MNRTPLLLVLVACTGLDLTAGCATARSATGPAKAVADAGVSDTWRAQPPPPGAEPPLTLPVFEEAQLKNGLRVLVSTRKDLPLVSLVVAFGAGSASDPTGRGGTADLTYRLMVEGAGKRNALQIAEAFADLGVAPVVAVQSDGALVGTQLLSSNAEAALALLADIAQRPHLTPADFHSRREERFADLLARETEPRVMAQNLLTETVYGAGHPYAHPTAGTSATLQRVEHTDVRSFYKKWVGPKAMALVLTGDVTLAQATAWAEKYFGAWNAAATRPAKPAPPVVEQRKRVRFAAKPGLDQTLILAGRPAVAAGSPDEPKLELVLATLGGTFGSRLNLNLREEKGYTYGATASLESRRGGGDWFAGTAVRADVTGPALSEMLKEIDGLRQKPVTAQELDAVRGALVRALPGSFETTESTAFALTSLFFDERPLDEYPRQAAALQAATVDDAGTMVERYFDSQTLQIVLVGDPQGLFEQLPPLSLGSLEEAKPPPTAEPTGRGGKGKHRREAH